MIAWAEGALVSGLDSPSLRVLAALSRSDPDDLREAETYLRRALVELGMEFPTADEIERARACRIAREMIAGARSAYDGAYWLNDLYLGREAGMVWARLLDAFVYEAESGERSPLAPEGAERAMLTEASRLLASLEFEQATGESETGSAFIESVINEVLPGLTLFCRDADLLPACLRAYQPGIVVREPGFIDMTPRFGGLVRSHRYVIATAHARDMSMLSPHQEWRMATLASSAYLKVLDVYERAATAQITLLHIPERAVRLFLETRFGFEDQIVEHARRLLDRALSEPPLQELLAPEWLARTRQPIGIDEEGRTPPR